jgi:hypothetical protein
MKREKDLAEMGDGTEKMWRFEIKKRREGIWEMEERE